MTTLSLRQAAAAPVASAAPLTKAEAYRLYQVLGQMKSFVSEPRHVYAVVLARKKLQAEAETIEELSKTPERIQQLESRRHELCREYSSTDASGQPRVTADQQYLIDPERRAEFETRIIALRTEHQADITAYQETVAKINAFVQEPSEVQGLPRIPVSALSGSLSVEQMEALFPILTEDGAAT